MKKYFLAVASFFIYSHISLGQVYPGQIDSTFVPVRSHHYDPELTFDFCVNEPAWSNQAGIHSAFGSTDRLYFRKEVPVNHDNDLSSSYSTTVWRGERANAQILVWSSEALEQVRVSTQDLRSAEGNIIPKDRITFELVRYVLSNYPYAEKKAICGESPYKSGFLMPDRFETLDRFDLPSQTTRPVWMMVDVPRGTVPGTYKGQVEVRAKGKAPQLLNLEIVVQNQLLPYPKDWKYRLDLWQNPWAVAWYNHVEPWSPEHKMLLKQHLKHYADAGGTYITTYGVHSPWSDNSYMIEGGMIEWIKKADGTWAFDYKIFDEYVELAMECGIDEAITLYTPIPWGFRHRYKDEATGDYSYINWAPSSEEFKKMWNIFLTDFKFHLEAKSWLDITYIGINENPMEETLAAINVVRNHDKCWKITYAGNWHKELDGLLDDYSFLYGEEPTIAEQKARAATGRTSTVYVCCNPPIPNNFVFSPPIEGRWISWYVMAYGYDGFLRWAYDAWPEDADRDARHGSWAAGDCYMVYPGGKSCIRFEKMREGIVDFEKVRILRELTAQSGNAQAQGLLKQLDQHLSIFPKEKEFDENKISADVRKGNLIIRQLSDLLAK